MSDYLSAANFPSSSPAQADGLALALETLLREGPADDMYALLAGYQRILADNRQRRRWPGLHARLQTLFQCGSEAVLDGPMIGVTLSIRDTDWFRKAAGLAGHDRSLLASVELMATAWNMTFADTGLWMGKTFEPVAREVVADRTGDQDIMALYDPESTRIGRNFFREPPDPDLVQGLGLPYLTRFWHLRPRPTSTDAEMFGGRLLAGNLEKEKSIPYSMTGGIFLANPGTSVVPEMNGRRVYQLNYRWPRLHPAFPVTLLIDELVRIDEGIYLGQLVFASRHFSLGELPLATDPEKSLVLGEPYTGEGRVDYGYQNNGYFLMLDPAFARQVYADTAFPQLRPRPGESGYHELGYDRQEEGRLKKDSAGSRPGKWPGIRDWVQGWQDNDALCAKFTTFLREESPRQEDGDVRGLRQENESILQMLQRISRRVSASSAHDDRLRHFEKFNRLFRSGIAPRVENGLFQGHGSRGYNCRVDGSEPRDWYGVADVARGFDFYHGANLNLHLGFTDTWCPDPERRPADPLLFPATLGSMLTENVHLPNLLDIVWHSIGKYIFPWAGKSFERISGRKLSMLLDESDDLARRYPARVAELRRHLASLPHYALVEKAAAHYWSQPGLYADHLADGPWDDGMAAADREFWQEEARNRWVDGCNIEDRRILVADALFRIIDMNYRTPDPALQAISEAGPSPFARQGYIFLGTSDRDSILPMNSGDKGKKKVFQFHYRYPLVGGPAPIGFCVDELVEIADGLFLGQLIYATALDVGFRSSLDPAEYRYQLFGYFLLMDDAWEYHRRAIGLDVWQHEASTGQG